MRGIAILFIVLHNLLHLLLPTKENEYIYVAQRSQVFLERLLENHPDLWMDLFSFLGWYGVAVFLFLSGYGLTRKYGFSFDQPLKSGAFVWKHIKSVFLLMILPYLPFAMMQIYYQFDWLQVLLQTTLLANVFSPNLIFPGVFWFFGLIIQFYLLFVGLVWCNRVKLGGKVLLVLNISALLWMCLLESNSGTLNWVRHNFIGWLLPFSMGIWVAQRPMIGKMFDALWKNLFWVVVGGAIVTLSNYNYYSWVFSSAFAVVAAVGLTKLLSRVSLLDRWCVWMGTISAFLFAVHPSIRFLCSKICWNEMTRFPYVMSYLLVSILVAIIYREVHKRLFGRWLS